jgi:hypothetical protein
VPSGSGNRTDAMIMASSLWCGKSWHGAAKAANGGPFRLA